MQQAIGQIKKTIDILLPAEYEEYVLVRCILVLINTSTWLAITLLRVGGPLSLLFKWLNARNACYALIFLKLLR